jgi:hypothetical protein
VRDVSGLTAADLDAIASRVVELLRQEPRLNDHVDTVTLAAMVGVSGDWVQEHAAELGAIRVGDGPKGTLRFDLRRVKRPSTSVASSNPATASAGVGRAPRVALEASSWLPLPDRVP